MTVSHQDVLAVIDAEVCHECANWTTDALKAVVELCIVRMVPGGIVQPSEILDVVARELGLTTDPEVGRAIERALTRIDYRLIRPDGAVIWSAIGVTPEGYAPYPPVQWNGSGDWIYPPWRYEQQLPGGEWELIEERTA